MNLLKKSVKVTAIASIVFACSAIFHACAGINAKQVFHITTTNNETYSKVHSNSNWLGEGFLVIKVVKTGSQAFLPRPGSESTSHQSAKAAKTNNIFEWATIFNDKLQQLIAALSHFLISTAHAETADEPLKMTTMNNGETCQLTH